MQQYNYINKPSRGVSRLPTVFLPRKLSKYRLKPPKDILLGNPKKPDKTPKNGQFWTVFGKNWQNGNFFQKSV